MLRSLHELDIQDKHHTLIPHASMISTPSASVKLDGLGNPIGFDEGRVELEVNPEEPPIVKFTFPKDGLFSGEEVLLVLKQLHDLVSEIVDSFSENRDVDAGTI